MNAGIDWRWERFADYLDVVDAKPKGINYATYIGHSALRTWAMGERAFESAASEDDLDLMAEEVRLALDAGAIGFSTSRSDNHETADDRPVASRLATWDEVRRLVGQMKGRTRAVFELAPEGSTRTSDDEASREFFDRLTALTQEAETPATFGVVGGQWRKQLAALDDAAAAGGHVFGQCHSRGVSIILSFKTILPFDHLPEWKAMRAQPLAAQASALRDPETRAKLVEAVRTAVYRSCKRSARRGPRNGTSRIFLFDKPLPPYRSVAELKPEARGVHPVEVMIDESLARDMDCFFLAGWHPGDAPAALLEIMRHPRTVMTFSDSGAHVGQIADSSIQSHLIAYWHRDQQAFTLPQAVNLITARPADAWGLKDRGRIGLGQAADLNIFDPRTFGPALPEVAHDLPTGARRLVQRAVGMKATIVGGEVLIEDGRHTGSALPGRLIRRRDVLPGT